MPDVQLGQVRNGADRSDVAVVDSVSGVDLQPQIVRLRCGSAKAGQFPAFRRSRKRVCESAGVQLDDLDPKRRGSRNLLGNRVDKNTNADACGLEALDRQRGAEQVEP